MRLPFFSCPLGFLFGLGEKTRLSFTICRLRGIVDGQNGFFAYIRKISIIIYSKHIYYFLNYRTAKKKKHQFIDHFRLFWWFFYLKSKYSDILRITFLHYEQWRQTWMNERSPTIQPSEINIKTFYCIFLASFVFVVVIFTFFYLFLLILTYFTAFMLKPCYSKVTEIDFDIIVRKTTS